MGHFVFQRLFVFEMTGSNMVNNVRIGDLVKYRAWQPGDVPIDTVDPARRSWGKVGIVVDICDWTMGKSRLPGEAVIMLDENADFLEVHYIDVEIITPVTKSAN